MLQNFFNEPDIPLRDKVILGPIDKYKYYSKVVYINIIIQNRQIPMEASYSYITDNSDLSGCDATFRKPI